MKRRRVVLFLVASLAVAEAGASAYPWVLRQSRHAPSLATAQRGTEGAIEDAAQAASDDGSHAVQALKSMAVVTRQVEQALRHAAGC